MEIIIILWNQISKQGQRKSSPNFKSPLGLLKSMTTKQYNTISIISLTLICKIYENSLFINTGIA